MLQKLRSLLVMQTPQLLSVPIKFTPFILQKQFLTQFLNWHFKQAVINGDLVFLEGRWLKIEIIDMALTWSMSVSNNQLIVEDKQEVDVAFAGYANDLILVAARRIDPDMLFFQRRLMISGDTELGLYIKNLLSSFELETMPKPLQMVLFQLANFIESGLADTPVDKAMIC